MATDVSSPFAFIRSDVKRQFELSKDIVEQIREIDATLQHLEGAGTDKDALDALRRRRDRLMIIAKELADNATETSGTATTVITDVTSKST